MMSMVRSHLPGASPWPHIDCVIIGVNCAQTLARCLASVQAADYPADRLHIYYADGGSTDGSLEIAGQFAGVTIIPLSPEYPTPGLGRNRGWQQGTSPVIQFLDSDTVLNREWLKNGTNRLNEASVGAVLGLRQEMHPQRSLFNWIGDLEWDGPSGIADCFGGDVMVRREVLETTGGYDEVLVGGEDPELSRRVIRAGWRVVRLPEPMTRHDLAMYRAGQYLKRAFRSGYGFAAVREREARQKSDFWRYEMRKIVIRGGGFALSVLLALLLAAGGQAAPAATGLLCLAVGTGLLFRPRLFLVNQFKRQHSLTTRQARRYAWHCSVVVLPQVLGIARFYWGKWTKRPLRNRRPAPAGRAAAPDGSIKHIAYLCSEYPAVSQTFIFREIASLRQAGFQVTPISVHRQSNLDVMTGDERREAENTLVMTSLGLASILAAHLGVLRRSPAGYARMTATALTLVTKGPKHPFKALAYWAEAGILLSWMHQAGIRHVHEHFAAPTAIVAMLAKRYGSVSYSLSVHGPDIFFYQDSELLADKVNGAEFTRCISHFCRSQLMRITPPDRWSRLHIVRCGVDPEVYDPLLETGNAVPEILCVGRLVPAKGQHVLLEACSLLKDRRRSFRLTFVGGGKDRVSLERYAAAAGLNGQVRFTGPLGQDEVRHCYDQADLFVLASFAEGVPVVLMEAMAKTIPVVSTRIAGIPELIDHEENGLLVDAGDAEGLARQMERLILDPALRGRLGAAGREKINRQYHLHRNNRQMADLFQMEGVAP